MQSVSLGESRSCGGGGGFWRCQENIPSLPFSALGAPHIPWFMVPSLSPQPLPAIVTCQPHPLISCLSFPQQRHLLLFGPQIVSPSQATERNFIREVSFAMADSTPWSRDWGVDTHPPKQQQLTPPARGWSHSPWRAEQSREGQGGLPEPPPVLFFIKTTAAVMQKHCPRVQRGPHPTPEGKKFTAPRLPCELTEGLLLQLVHSDG